MGAKPTGWNPWDTINDEATVLDRGFSLFTNKYPALEFVDCAMRKYCAIGLLLLMIVNSTFHYLYFFIQHVAIKIERHELLRESPLNTLTRIELTLEDFKGSLIEEDELEIDGKMFDIVKTDRFGETVLVYGAFDPDEDMLMNFLDAVTLREHETSSGEMLDIQYHDYLPALGLMMRLESYGKVYVNLFYNSTLLARPTQSIFLPPECACS